MSAKDNAATASPVTVVGKLPTLSKNNLNRISAFLVQDQALVTEAPVTAAGTFQFRLLPPIVFNPCWIVILGPRGLDVQTLLSRTELPRLPLASAASNLASAREGKASTITLDFTKLNITDKIIDLWWIWCRTYTVSGVLQSANGCPVPGAELTVYNVRTGFIGPVKSPIETVTTDAQGKFTATFNWCECLCCWPCWPIWWHCWPWWWERDILAVLDTIERQIPGPGPQIRSQLAASSVPLKRPAAADLMTGRGFSSEVAELKQDSARTSLIASKFANPRIRELFPWWWWCCDNPNLVFSATQAGNVVLDEDPATSTRWCFPSGQSVTLIANSEAFSVCPPPPVCEGFAWVSVGNPGTLVTNIINGYAKGTPGTDASDLAFSGFLNLYGGFSDQTIPFYQVWSGLWTGNENPARGGVAPATAQTLAVPLSSNVVIYRNATNTFDFIPVTLGPCSFMGINNLYMTTSQRMNPPAGVTGLGSTPTLNPGDFVVTWSNAGRIMGVDATALVSPQAGGGVSLWAIAYDAAGTELALVNNNPLTLMIDTRSLSQAVIDSLLAFDHNNNPVGSTSSTTGCPGYHIGPGGYLLMHVTVTDNDPSPSLSVNEHLEGYYIATQYGGSTGVTTSPASRGYSQSPASFTGVDGGYGVPNPAQVSFIGGGDTIRIDPTVSCCYDFQLWVGKRVTDGQDFFGSWGNPDFRVAIIDVS